MKCTGVEEMSGKSENTIRREAQIATCWHGNSLGAGYPQFPGGYGYVSCCPKGCEHCHTLAIAIAIHNIPEGISVSVPVF